MKNTFITALSLISSRAFADDICRALVLSGGSNNGAWEAGVIWGLTHYGTPSDYAWNTVSGVSAGAINTGGIATWATGTEVEMTEWLSDSWASISDNDEIWELRTWNPIKALFHNTSLLDDDPALNFLKGLVAFKGEIARSFTTGAVDVNSGDYIALNNDNITFDELAQAALSSGSIPVVFPPQHLKNWIFMDGGTVWNTNLTSAVQECAKIVDNDYSKIVIDVAICGY